MRSALLLPRRSVIARPSRADPRSSRRGLWRPEGLPDFRRERGGRADDEARGLQRMLSDVDLGLLGEQLAEDRTRVHGRVDLLAVGHHHVARQGIVVLPAPRDALAIRPGSAGPRRSCGCLACPGILPRDRGFVLPCRRRKCARKTLGSITESGEFVRSRAAGLACAQQRFVSVTWLANQGATSHSSASDDESRSEGSGFVQDAYARGGGALRVPWVLRNAHARC